ncbi:hypothetical protein HRbin17_00563 [bacterium HR17]|uniref:DUF4380 domain-containing protein n=1 Tax=Candidatus Fervidibacter japonicus TaxID=2035412 RepID=A0A2H5XA52_9BACT|nr:hypothetical protein HRbin17_00563 [bacterium HR17]
MVERIAYAGWQNCYRVSNGVVEVVATADVGPRLIRFGFVGGPNEFAEFTDQLGKVGGDAWRIYGGHRLWHAPEHPQRTYYPDNEPVQVRVVDEWTLELIPPTERTTGVQKTLRVALHPDRPQVTVTHILTNHNLWAIELAAWALSVMAPGGVALLPQPPFIPHGEKLLPARPLVQWHYTDMTDPRWTFGKRFILLRQDPTRSTPQKLGIANPDGWCAYANGDRLFVKIFQHREGAPYPDFGCSTEVFTDATMLELETLSPLTRLEPGGHLEHVERWHLFSGVTVTDDEDQIAAELQRVFADLS